MVRDTAILLSLQKRSVTVANDYFRFKGFTIRQERTAMKVGTDGVLLGSWAPAPHRGCILDVGSGTGLIAIMMAQRCGARVTALEIDRDAFLQARENIENCMWHHRIDLIHQSFQDYCKSHTGAFDVIVSNPPWFRNALPSPTSGRNKARHNSVLPWSDLLEGGTRLLKDSGVLSLILPYEEAGELITEAEKRKLYCTERMNIRPNIRKAPKRVMMNLGFTQRHRREETIAIEKDQRHHFTPAYRHLTKSFYLYF